MTGLDRENWRLYWRGWRLHHGFFGAIGAVISLAMMVHDWRDRWWRPRRETGVAR